MEKITKVNYENEEVVFKIENGVSYVRVNEVAKFCGWSRVKNDNEYIMWDRVNEYLQDLNFPQKCGKEDFIPEYIMYALIGKAKNEKATQFMLWVGQVLTEIRSTGRYDNKEHEIMKIEDEEERKLTLEIYKLEELFKLDKEELTALRLDNKKNKLEQYKQSKALKELQSKTEECNNKVSLLDDKIKKAMVLREGDKSAIAVARHFNVFSISNKPHNRFADCMARTLGFYVRPEGNIGYQDDYVSINLTTVGGVTTPTIKYSELAIKKMEEYINSGELTIENPTVYKRNCKNGNKGDFYYSRIIFDEIDDSIKINKLTYDLFNSQFDEE